MNEYLILAATGLALGIAAPSHATSVSALLVPTATGSIADDVTFSFTGLSNSDGAGGTLAIIGRDMDLGNDPREHMVVTLDAVNLGQWVCDSTPVAPAQFIPGAVGANFCDFSLTLSIGSVDLDTILADGAATLQLAFGPFVNVNPGSQLHATLSYADAPLAPVPIPAGGLLLATGVAAFAVARRKRAV